MRQGIHNVIGRLRCVPPGVAVSVVVAGLLTACASSGQGPGLRDRIFGQTADAGAEPAAGQDYGPDFFLQTGYCPPVTIRTGGAAYAKYERGHDGERDFITYQGSIVRAARECHMPDAQTLTINLGVAGRVIAGPKGTAGSVTLPVHVTVMKQHGNQAFFDRTFNVPVVLPAELGTDYSQVFDQIVFKVTDDDRDLQVFVGFDNGDVPGA